MAKKNRPKHLDLTKIRLPLPAIVSILHRVTGVMIFATLPVLLYLLQSSLASGETFETYKQIIAIPVVKLFLFVLLWGYTHHLCAGVRFLLLDLHKGVYLPQARVSARVVFFVSIPLAIILGAWLW